MGVNGTAISSISRDVYGELMMTGVDMLHVPYRGGAPALTYLPARQVQIMFNTLITSIEHIRTGKLRALAVTAATRVEVLPDMPTVGDFVPGCEAVGWQRVGGPRPSRLSISSTKRPMPVSPIPASKSRIADYGYAA